MKFEELLKKYTDGTATDSERQTVEEEMEKFRLLEELLAADEPLPLPEVPEAEVKQVRRTIDRRTRRTAMAVAAGVLAAIALLQFLLLPWLNSRVFQDGFYAKDGSVNPYELWLDCVDELYIPQYYATGSGRETTGFGQWTVHSIFWSMWHRDFPGQHADGQAKVTAGIFQLTRSFTELFPPINLTDRPAQPRVHDEALERLGEDVVVLATVVFEKDLTMQELMDFRDTWWSGRGYFCAALNDKAYGRPIHLDLSGGHIGWGEAANEGYPLLWTGMNADQLTAADWQQHLESRLQYLIDHPYLTNKIEPAHRLQSLLERIQTDGPQFQGVWVSGRAQDLLALYDSGMVMHIYPVSLSLG